VGPGKAGKMGKSGENANNGEEKMAAEIRSITNKQPAALSIMYLC